MKIFHKNLQKSMFIRKVCALQCIWIILRVKFLDIFFEVKIEWLVKKKKLNFTTVSRDSSSVDYAYTFKAPCVKSVEFPSIQHTRVNCSFVVWRFRATAYRQFNAIGLNLVFLPRMNEESTCLDMILLVQLCFECNDSVDWRRRYRDYENIAFELL